MNAVDIIAEAARSTGYRDEAIFRDYAFADVLDPAGTTRKVTLAAFAQTPPSYRTAALAAVPAGKGETQQLVRAHRALGAPLLFVVEGDQISLWQVCGETPRRLHEGVHVDDVHALFEQNRNYWHPDTIHRAKLIGAVDKNYQLDFVDLGLLPAVEGEIHTKLDRLLVDTLAASSKVQNGKLSNTRFLFHMVFRLLAAKVLQDRGHPDAQHWDADDLASVLDAIEFHYSLAPVEISNPQHMMPAVSAAWECLRRGISFANISADDLAFVYENTLVTPETRKALGTHSTPRQLAEYAVTRLGLHHHNPEDLFVYEPFAGAGTFLVSALRHIRDLLPGNWNDQQRHNFLIRHLAGDEIDAFACEVATLSLILADYPNRNGWRVIESDLFVDRTLHDRLRENNVILCNPPFQDFTTEERLLYPVPKEAFSKPIEVLTAVLEAAPLAFAFVLPRTFIRDRKFAAQRKRIEMLYGDVEVVELPDRIFHASGVESALVIAREPKSTCSSAIKLQSTDVSDQDRVAFLQTGRTTSQRRVEREGNNPLTGELWIPPLSEVWEYLRASPLVGCRFAIHQGMRWTTGQGEATSPKRRPGYRRGLHSARGTRQFVLGPSPPWLDCRPERIRASSIERPWDVPKLMVNAGRLSRGPWRIGAALDREGLLCSQQFFGLWPLQALLEGELLAFVAILNGPLANAFLAVHSPAKGIRMSMIQRIPIPPSLPARLGELVAEYIQCLTTQDGSASSEDRAETLLLRIDAEVLESYNLPLVRNEDSWSTFADRVAPLFISGGTGMHGIRHLG